MVFDFFFKIVQKTQCTKECTKIKVPNPVIGCCQSTHRVANIACKYDFSNTCTFRYDVCGFPKSFAKLELIFIFKI